MKSAGMNGCLVKDRGMRSKWGGEFNSEAVAEPLHVSHVFVSVARKTEMKVTQPLFLGRFIQ